MPEAKHDWENVPTVFIYRSCCPTCRSERYKPIKGKAELDGSSWRRCICDNCGSPYLVISEPLPEVGSDEDGDGYYWNGGNER